jgi:carboxymethylenebutenolidase
VTDQLAEAGYIAIAPDLLSGAAFSAGDLDAARKAIASLPPDQITKDLNAVVDHVSKLPACNGKVGVAGFCWGGAETFRYATNNKNIKAAFSFYGSPPDSADAIARIQCPVYGFYGENDNRINAAIPKAVELMKAAGKTYEPVTYDGAGHGFMRAGEDPAGNEANKKARESAWARWLGLLKKL